MIQPHKDLDASSHHHQSNAPVEVDLEKIDKIKATYVPPYKGEDEVTLKENPLGACFHARAWLEKFTAQKSWKMYSQGDQDAVLKSLFANEMLGTTNKEFVEFGFPDRSWETSYGNGRMLREKLGFNTSLLLDLNADNPAINLHKQFCTADNIVSTFEKYNVPLEPDYASLDVDSCDLWLFLAITTKYRPRVFSIEYNSNYPWDDYSTQRCENPTEVGAYSWTGDNIYGASLQALELAARLRGYTLVYVTPMLDAHFVRDDLICPSSAVPVETFQKATGISIHAPYNGIFGPKEELLMDFRSWDSSQWHAGQVATNSIGAAGESVDDDAEGEDRKSVV